jgi:hypothetical protein
LTAFLAANPSLHFQEHNFLKPDAGIDWAGLDPARHVPQMRSYQRLSRLGLDAHAAERFIGANLHSGNHIARVPPRRFIEQVAPQLGLDKAAAEQLHRNALGIQNKAYQVWASVRGTVASPFFRGRPFSTVGSSLEVFEDLPSYQEMFGSLDYCRCTECRSIFGPAAYLVDLQRIIDEYVTQPNSATIPAGLKFAERRPDIGKIELTCANTDTLLPYLQVVNERLIDYAQGPLNAAGPAAVMKQLATSRVYPRILPFNQPLNQIEILLAQVGAPWEQLLAAWGSPASIVAARKMRISPDSAAILTTPVVAANVAPFYNGADPATLSDPSVFIANTGLDFGKLGDLIEQDLSPAEITAGLQANFFINAGLSGKWVTLARQQPHDDWALENLAPALDPINRQLRLSDALGWSSADTDWAIRCANGGGTPVISDAAIMTIGAMRDAMTRLALTLPQATALFGPIKTYGQGSDGAGNQFDLLFNTATLVAQAGSYHPADNSLNASYKDTALPWTPGSPDAADAAAISRVLPGLRLSLSDANALGLAIYGAAQQHLDVTTLSRLYRHAVLAQALMQPINRYVMLLKVLGLSGSGPFKVGDLATIQSTAAWMANRGVTVYQLDYIVNDTASVYVALPYQPAAVTTCNTWQRALIQQAGLASGTDLPNLITSAIAALFGITTAALTPIRNIALQAVTRPDSALSWDATFVAVDAKGVPLYPAYVANVLDWCSRWLVLQATLNLSDALVANVSDWPAAYGLTAKFTTLPLSAVQYLDAIQTMIDGLGDTQNKLLLYIEQVGQNVSQDTALATLQQATGWPTDQAKQLLVDKKGAPGPVAGAAPLAAQLGAMATIFDFMASTGMDASLMKTVAALAGATAVSAWGDYLAAVPAVLGAVQSRYGNTWATIAGPMSGKLEVAERDALVALVMSELRGKYEGIRTPRNVYEFLFIDVEMGPETQISYIKEALNASQLYLQRCRLGLEQGIVEFDIPPAWWEWMLNYRVWEANREIFVYPENYLDPTLRKTTTPQFAQLQQDLLQSEVTKDYVEQCFDNYMESFLGVAQLKPAEAYRCIVNDPQQGHVGCTFLFARGNTDPVTFYWSQQLDGMPWTAWQEIKININADTVTPVYAFGRLFVFWVEVAPGRGSSIEQQANVSVSTASVNYKATIYYSFLNTQNKWVQAQTLASDEIVYYASTGAGAVSLAGNKIFSGLFDLTKQAWRRVAVLHASAKNFRTPPQSQSSEKIAVMYGPFLHDSGATIDPGPPPNTSDPAALAFYASLKSAIANHNQVVASQFSGHQLIRRALVINALLDDSILLHKEEFYLLDAYLNPTPLNQVTAQLSNTEASLILSSSPTVMSDTLVSDPNAAVIAEAKSATVTPATFVSLFIDPATAQNVFNQLVAANIINGNKVDPAKLTATNLVTALDSLVSVGGFSVPQVMDVQKALFASVGGAALFGSVNPIDSKVATVKNQPGWFVFYSGGEAFLLAPQQIPSTNTKPVFASLDDGATVAAPPITPASFVFSYDGKGVNAAASNQIYKALAAYSVVTNGVYDTTTSFSTFTLVVGPFVNASDKDHQVRACFNIANNAPIVQNDLFVSSSLGIDSATSAGIYKALVDLSIIDATGRVSIADLLDPANVKLALANLLNDGKVTPYQVPALYAMLNQAPSAVALNYANTGDASAFSGPADFKFSVTRLTTAAVGKLDRALFAGSVDALLSTDMQGYPVFPVMPFSRFDPNPNAKRTGKQNITLPTALDGAQVDFDGLYGQYFWEIFFHVPRLVASMLESNQNYQDAVAWLQYVFNPTLREQFVTAAVLSQQTNNALDSVAAPKVITALQSQKIGSGSDAKPILNEQGRVNPALSVATDLSFLANAPLSLSTAQILMVQAILLNYELATTTCRFWRFFPLRNQSLEKLQDMLTDDKAIAKYNSDPFDPYAIARLRVGAFEKAVVMQYIDALIQWGDMLFSQDTWESITAASLVYVYASDLLGSRPVEVGECPGSAQPVNFNDIQKAYAGVNGGIPQFLIDLEHLVPGGKGPSTPIVSHAFNDLNVYFCVPENDVLMSYWDRVDDRLYKIEHSMNIHGQFRTLALFEPPINPLDLVRAALAGNNVQATTGAAGPPTALPYRFESAVAFARRVLDSVTGFAAQLLAALEKRDAEGLSMLQTNQASQILNMTVKLKQERITEVQKTIDGLQASLQSANYRVKFYSGLIQQNLLPEEQTSLDAMTAAMVFNVLASALNAAAAIGYAVPQVGSPFAMTYGGVQLGSIVQASAGAVTIGAEISNYVAQRSQTTAGYQRRLTEWTYQQQLATDEVSQITANIAAAQAQLAQARQDLGITTQQHAQNAAIAVYLASKFTNQQLYAWMVSRLSAIYFQAFQVALRAAQAAEDAYRLETDTDATFISFSYWNNLYKGLLAGEGLRAALDQMENSYRAGNARRLEIVKVVSLAFTDPAALMALKTTGTCNFSLTEASYDYDYPGHYARKLTSISASIPALVGPYQTVKATLTQTGNHIVTKPDIAVVKYLLGLNLQQPSQGLRTDWLKNQSVAISQAVDDSGMFVLNFSDERYLPFENTGAVSDWTLDMPLTTNRFDFSQLSDVILTIRYTALSDGKLQQHVQQTLAQKPYEGGLYVDVRRQQPTAWNAFLVNRASSTTEPLVLAINPAQFGFFKSVRVTHVLIRLDLGAGATVKDGAKLLTLTAGTQSPQTPTISGNVASLDNLTWEGSTIEGDWTLAFDLSSADIAHLLSKGYIDPDKLRNVEMIIVYTGKVF